MDRHLLHTVTKAENGKAVKTILRDIFSLSGTQIKKIRHGNGLIIVDGVPIRTVDPVYEGSVIDITLPNTVNKKEIRKYDIPLEILYEDDDIIAVNKPAGILTHPISGCDSNTLANVLASKLGTGFIFRPVGRLDKYTSGILIAAKTSQAQTALIHQMNEDLYHKEYLAICKGVPADRQGTICVPISKVQDSSHRRYICDDGLPAKTSYLVLSDNTEYSVLSVRLYTGRTHQIRVHMAYIGFPLLGDFLYGSESELIPRPALHCSYISFLHPVTGKRIEIHCAAPRDMQTLIGSFDTSFPFFSD